MVSMHWVPIQDTWQAVHKVHKWMVCSLSGVHTWPSWKQHVNVWWLTRCGWSGMFMQTQSALVEQMHCQGESSIWISSARQGLWVWSSVYQGTQICVYWHAINLQGEGRSLLLQATYWHKCMPTLIASLSLCWYRVRKPSGADTLLR